MKKYENERDGQLDFYSKFLPRVDQTLLLDEILTNNTDGILNGNILEFKLKINDLNKTLFQTIKYLSNMRIKGKEIPKNIILISLNDGKTYLFDSKDYLEEIERVYTGSGSKNNEGFVVKNNNFTKYEFDKKELDKENLIIKLKEKKYTKINIDENCIVGWAERFYKEKPNATKSDFIGDPIGQIKIVGEIRKPSIFKEFINPYTKESNIKFEYLMDKLNDNLQKKQLGAFYTPELYVKKSYELLYKAIERVPEGNDYIILDRCAGTGNLEKFLPDEILSHCIVSTIEYYEYKVLMEKLGDKVRHIIPPTEVEDTFNMGLVRGADALSEEYVNNEVIKQYLDDPKCTVILFENPPYAEAGGIETQKIKSHSAEWKKSYVATEMKKEIKGVASNDLANLFIWSGFKYYLRQNSDSYILYSPIKYWKGQKLIDKNFLGGFGFNRRHFHASTDAFIGCILWSNEEKILSEIKLINYNIDKDINQLVEEGTTSLKRVDSVLSVKYYDKRTFNDDEDDNIFSSINGLEKEDDGKASIKSIKNNNIIAYLVASGNTFDNPRLGSFIVRCGAYGGHGFWLRSDNYLEKLPLLATGKYTDHDNNWKIMSQLMRSGDGSDRYLKAVKTKTFQKYLLKTLFWVSLTHYSHMRSLIGKNGKLYRNELCFDNTNGETIASKDIKQLTLNKEEQKLMKLWNDILSQAKQTANYNPQLTYGLYQIDEELNTKYKDEKDKTVYNYPLLNGNIQSLKALLKQYYLKELIPTLFKYEFLK